MANSKLRSSTARFLCSLLFVVLLPSIAYAYTQLGPKSWSNLQTWLVTSMTAEPSQGGYIHVYGVQYNESPYGGSADVYYSFGDVYVVEAVGNWTGSDWGHYFWNCTAGRYTLTLYNAEYYRYGSTKGIPVDGQTGVQYQ